MITSGKRGTLSKHVPSVSAMLSCRVGAVGAFGRVMSDDLGCW